MNKTIQNIIIFLALAFSYSVNAQVSVVANNTDIIQGKLRLKLKREYLKDVNTLAPIGKKQSATTGITSLDNLNESKGIKRMKRVFPFSLKDEAKHREYGLHLWYEIDFDNSVDPLTMVDDYALLEEVEIAKPLYKKIFIDGYNSDSTYVYLDTANIRGNKITYGKKTNYNSISQSTESNFDDPLLSKQWHYQNDGTVGDKGVDIDLFNAWTKSTGDSRIVVAIVDGGIDIKHEDLKENLWVNELELNGEEGVDDDGNGYVDDIHGYNFVYNNAGITNHIHGTHVAGTVSAENNNGLGVAGVAGGDGSGNGVRLMSCQIYDDRGGEGNHAAAIVYGADNGAIISQNSWGYNQPGFFEPEVYDAIKYFIAEAGSFDGSLMKGGVVFFASGNTGKEEKHYPASFPEVISVASSGPTGYPAPYTTYGDWVTITAPGGDQAYFDQEGGILSTFPDNEYGYLQGTSMSCPHASGVAALVAAKFGGDNFRARDMKKIIINSTTPFSYDSEGKYGTGNLNAVNALIENEFIAPEAITDLAATDIFHNEVRLEWSVPKDEDDFQPSAFIFVLSNEEITESNFEELQKYVIDSNYEVGTKMTAVIGGLLKQTNYWFALKSVDRHNNISDISNIVKVTTTNAPSFEVSTRNLEYQIDITNNAVQKTPITFSNSGEGIVYWNSTTVNERPFWISIVDWASDKDEIIAASYSDKDSSKPSMGKTQSSSVHKLTTSELSKNEGDDYLFNNDNTYFTSGYFYNSGSPTDAIGSNDSNFGLTYATRFIPTDGEFNMTHVALGLLVDSKDPVFIEIRKGSEDLSESKTVYVQQYVPDNDIENVIKNYIVPLEKPQHFNQGEVFWVVLYFSRNETTPLLVHKGYYYPDTFYLSKDNGQTFYEAWEPLAKHYVPFVSTLSTGVDAPYVFLNPLKGEIHSGVSEELELIIDASKLSNGKHLATLGISTTDINKPGVGIVVKVEVTGQKADIEINDLYTFDLFKGKDTKLAFEIKNTGLDSLYVKDIIVKATGESVKSFEDNLVVRVNGVSQIPFSYNPSEIGVITPIFVLKTSIGDFDMSTKMTVTEPPVITASVDSDDIEMNYGETKTIKLTISNEGDGSILKYDLEKYNPATLVNGFNPDALRYKVKTSADLVDPVIPEIIDISSYATIRYNDGLPEWYNKINMENSFAMFDYNLQSINLMSSGNFFSNNVGKFDYEEGVTIYSRASGYIATLQANFKTEIKQLDYHSFGDKDVYTMTQRVDRAELNKVVAYGDITYQVVLHKNGRIDIHYIDVSNLDKIDGGDYAIGIQSATPGDYVMYKKKGEDSKRIYDGLTVSFIPENGRTFLGVVENREGGIAQGQSKTIDVTIDPNYSGVKGGSYTNYIDIKSNSLNGNYRIPITIKINGDVEYSTPDSVKFDVTRINYKSTKYVEVKNNGSGVGTINSVSFTNDLFNTAAQFPIIITPNSHVKIPVTFNAETVSAENSDMTVFFDDGSAKGIELIAQGEENPTYVINLAQNIEKNISGGETFKIPFTLQGSTDGGKLEYSFINNLFAKVEYTSEMNGGGEKNDSIVQYGYTRKVTDSTKVFHKWKDVKENGIAHDIKYENQYGLKIPFDFPFYGEVFDSIWISKNGYVSVVKPEKDLFTGKFNKDDGIRGIIAPFMSDLIPADNNSKIWTLVEDDRVYVLWDVYKGTNVSSSGGVISFQLEIVNDGTIFFHYGNVETFGGLLVFGLESPDESETFEEDKSSIIKWSSIRDSLTMAISAPINNELSDLDTESFNLLLSAKYIYKPGTYRDTVMLKTNSETQKEYLIPVVLNVVGDGVLEVSDSLYWDQLIFAPNGRFGKKVIVRNTGHDKLTINNIKDESLFECKIFDKDGVEIKRTIGGTLFKKIKLEPWTTQELYVEFGTESLRDISGKVILGGDFVETSTKVVANVVESPEFVWDAVDKSFSLVNTDKPEYNISISNNGKTALEYSLFPAVVPTIVPGEDPDSIVDYLGNYSLEKPIIVDSTYLEIKEVADGYEAPLVPTELAFSNMFTAPKDGFFLTHIKVNANIKAVDNYIKIEVYKGGDKPQEGKLMYSQNFLIDRYVDDEWVYFPLEFPISFAEGETFYLVVIPPPAQKYIGFDIAKSEDELDNTWGANYRRSTQTWQWKQFKYMMRKYKIRAITAAGEGMWLSLDNIKGKLESGETKDVKVTIDPLLAGNGKHKGIVKISTNDVNNPKDEVTINIDVNDVPIIKFRPNSYEETIKVKEKEEITVNYLFEDLQNEALEFKLQDSDSTMVVVAEQTGGNSASVTFKPGFNDQGTYKYFATITDVAGNIVHDEILLEVIDSNRAPIMNIDYATITLNTADASGGLLTLEPNDLFTDPDGDDLNVLAGNYTPEILDMALGNNYINLHPLQTGTGFVVFGADDGKENGFVVYGVYVYVINDASNSDTETNGYSTEVEQLLSNGKRFTVYPNPVVANNTNVIFKLEYKGDVSIDIVNTQGIICKTIGKGYQEEGIFTEVVNTRNLSRGVYLFNLKVNNNVVESVRVLVK